MANALTFTILAVDKASKTFKDVGAAAEGTGKKSGGMGAAIGGAAKAGALALAGLGAASVKTEADFGQKMNQMGAVAGVPAKGLESLSALALKMGADTVFSAGDAADAMLELAKSGISAAQIEAGALSQTLTLAAAGGLEMGAAAAYMGNALNTFGLKAEQAGEVSAALAGAANASSASVETLGQALAQVGPGATNAGLSIQETTAALAAFSNAGIQGSDAGTSLKTFLQRLVPATADAAGAMKQVGFDATNADGSFKSLAEISQNLQDSLRHLTAEQRAEALQMMFGSDATRAATVLFKEGAKGVESYTKATSDQAAAQRIADSRMKGTAGSLEQLKGSVETAGLAIGKILAPYVQGLASGLTTLANGFTRNSSVVVPLVGVLVGLGATVWAINTAVRAVTATKAAWAAVTSLHIGRTIAHTAALVANKLVTVAVMGAYYALTAAQIVWSGVTKAVAAAQWLLNAALTANPIGIVVVAIAALVGALVYAWKNSETFRDVVLGAWNAIRGAFAAGVAFIVSVLNGGGGRIGAIIRGIASFFAERLQSMLNIASGVVNIIVGVFTGDFGRIKTGVSQAIGGVLSLVTQIPRLILNALGSLGGLLFNAGKDVIAGLIRGITSKIGDVGRAMSQVTDKISRFLPGSPVREGPLRVLNNGYAGKQIANMIAGGVESGRSSVASAIGGLSGTATASVGVDGLSAQVAGRSGGGVTINIHGPTDPAGAARAVRDELLKLKRSGMAVGLA